MEENYKLSHLKALEAESIHIIREVAAEFRNPVMLYSIGKDSSVMARLAEKAFYPGRPPFPLMHIDTKWKFKEMIRFRDWYAREHGWNLIVEYNRKAYEAGVGPFTHGSKVHTDLMKTQALLDALKKFRRSQEGRGKEPGKGKDILIQGRVPALGPEEPEARAVGHLQHPHTRGREHTRLPAEQLDGTRHLAVYQAREHPYRPALFREGAPCSRN